MDLYTDRAWRRSSLKAPGSDIVLLEHGGHLVYRRLANVGALDGKLFRGTIESFTPNGQLADRTTRAIPQRYLQGV